MQTGFDMSFRPDTYWEVSDAIYANVKGEQRRQAIRRALEEGTADDLDPAIYTDGLPRELVQALMRTYGVRHFAGETLPDCLPGEIEIARIAMPETVLYDIIVLRARPVPRGIAYRMLDDNAGEEWFTDDKAPRPRVTRRPLTMMQVVRIINRVGVHAGYGFESIREHEIASNRIVVTSEFYPELEAYFEVMNERWVRRHERLYGRTEPLPPRPSVPAKVMRRIRSVRRERGRDRQLPLSSAWSARWPGIGRNTRAQPQRLQRAAYQQPCLW